MLKKWLQKLSSTKPELLGLDKNSTDAYQPLSKTLLKKYSHYRENNPHQLFCYVPFNSMSFSFNGRALACVYNQKVELGRYPHNTIREIWFNSEMGNQLRDHLTHNDLNFGCKHCKYFVEHEKFSGLKPLVYDKYKEFNNNGYPKVIEFELSNICNYECVMCNGYVSSSIRKNRDQLPPIKQVYDDAFVEQLKEFIPHLEEMKFYGGEPFLIPIYQKIWDNVIQINPSIKIFTITNGSVLDEKIKNILDKGDFDLAVSLDSINPSKLESIRVNAEYDTLMANIQYFNEYCKNRKKKLVISFTMMRINYMDFYDVLHFCNKIDAILYVSYLKTPPQFAIWNLPSDTLSFIHQQASIIDLPKNSFVEKHNKKVYEDFLVYLLNAAEDNLNRDPKDLIPLGNDCTPSSIQLVTEYDPEVEYESLLKEKFLDDSVLWKKVENSINRGFSQKEINKIYYKMYSTPIQILKNDISKMNQEEIVSQIHKTLGKTSTY